MINAENAEVAQFIKHFDGADAIDTFVKYQCSMILDGHIDPLQYYIHSKALRKALDNIDTQIKDSVYSEATKYPEKKFEAFGGVVEKAETGVSYSYSDCHDPVWHDLTAQAELIKSKLKDRETFLKTLKEPITMVDEQTGETTKIYPPVKKGQEFIKVSFK
jgi:hypothetical protein